MLPNGSGMQLLDELKATKMNHLLTLLVFPPYNRFYPSQEFCQVKRFCQIVVRGVIHLKNVRLFPETRTVKVGEETLTLNRKEYDLLYCFY